MSPVLFLRVLSLEARTLMSYRADFWLNALAAFFAQLAVAYFLWLAVFETSGREAIGGFTLEGMVLYYLLAILLGKLVRGEERRLTISRDIYEGRLTRYLVFPGPYAGFKYAESLGSLVPGLVQLALLGAAAAVVLELPPDVELTAGSVARAAAAVAVGNLLHFLIVYPLQCAAFWVDNVWSLNVMLRFTGEFLGGLMLPLDVFPAAAVRVLELLPFQFLFYFPVMTLVGQVGPAEWARGLALALAWCAVIGLAGRVVWRRGARTYTGVGI